MTVPYQRGVLHRLHQETVTGLHVFGFIYPYFGPHHWGFAAVLKQPTILSLMLGFRTCCLKMEALNSDIAKEIRRPYAGHRRIETLLRVADKTCDIDKDHMSTDKNQAHNQTTLVQPYIQP